MACLTSSDLTFTVKRGDTVPKTFALTLEKLPYTPPAGSVLLFTVKLDPEYPDEQAIIQKMTGAGLSTSGSTATLTILHIDTKDKDAAVYHWDIQSQELSGAVYTVAQGKLVLTGDVTRELTNSITIYTTEPASSILKAITGFTGADSLETLTTAEGVTPLNTVHHVYQGAFGSASLQIRHAMLVSNPAGVITETNVEAGYVLPLDYDPDTNDVVWVILD